MKLLNVKPKDVYCLFEITYTDLKKIQSALNNATLALNLEDPEESEVSRYVTEDFFNEISDTIKGIEDGFT